LAEPLFERAWGATWFGIGAGHKLRRLRGQAFDFPKVIDLIGHDPEQAIRSKRAMDGDEEILGYNPAGPMPAFGPGIGEHQVKECDRIRRQHLLQCVGRFDPQNTRVGEFAVRNFPVRASHSPKKTFNSKKVSPWIGRGYFDEKGTVAATQIDLEGRAPAIDGLQIQRREIIRRNDFDVRRQSRNFSGLMHLN
jgi:hypothetical protein